MTRPRGAMLLAAALCVLAAPCALPGAAGAATFGSNDLSQPLSAAAHCSSYPCGIVDSVRGDGTDEEGAPIDGILTSVRMRYAGDGASVAFRVLRPSGSGSFLNVGPELPATLPAAVADSTVAVPVRRPIEAGDRLSLSAGSSLSGDSYLADGSPRECLRRQGSHAVGTTQAYSTSGCAAEVLLQGTVEPDLDADGYGDQTQDGCPTDPAIHYGPCSADLDVAATVTPGTLSLLDVATYRFTVTNRGTSPSDGVGLSVPVSESADLAGVSTDAGTCGGVRAVFCWLGTLDNGQTATVIVTVRPHDPGSLNVRSSAISSTLDPNPSNNRASALTNVVDPFAGVLLPQPKAFVRRGVARVLHGCPSDASRYCQGAATVARAAPIVPGGTGTSSIPASKGPRLGQGRFRLQPGAVSTVSVRLSKKAARTLARRHRMAVLVTVVAADGAGTRRTTYARVLLVQKH